MELPSSSDENVAVKAKTYRPLGAYRFLLATMVLVSHLRELGGEPIAWLAPLGIGNMGVMAFFVLSGYIIAEALAVFYRGRPVAFLVNRSLRIYPSFFIALALSIAVHAALATRYELMFFDPVDIVGMFGRDNIVSNSARLVVIYGTGILGVPETSYPFVRFDWAVAIELQFYFTIALLVWLAPSSRWYWPIVTCLFLAAFVLSMQTRWLYGSGWIPYFIAGVAMYRRKTSLMLVSLALVNWHAYVYISKNETAATVTCIIILDALLLLMWWLKDASIPQHLKRLDQFLGALTYSLYLNHYAVGILMLTVFQAYQPSMWLFAATLIVAMVFSYAAMQCAEPLTKRFRDRIRGQEL